MFKTPLEALNYLTFTAASAGSNKLLVQRATAVVAAALDQKPDTSALENEIAALRLQLAQALTAQEEPPRGDAAPSPERPTRSRRKKQADES